MKNTTPVMTTGITDAMAGMAGFTEFIENVISRFEGKDWGEIPAKEKKKNDAAITSGKIIVAAYDFPHELPTVYPNNMRKIWVIADRVGRSGERIVTILFPDEYQLKKSSNEKRKREIGLSRR